MKNQLLQDRKYCYSSFKVFLLLYVIKPMDLFPHQETVFCHILMQLYFLTVF